MSLPVLARVLALALLVVSISACAAATSPSSQQPYQPGMMGGRFSGPGMMGGAYAQPAAPGEPGFVTGTASAPRAVWIIAGPGLRFTPADVRIVGGETIRFEVMTMGPAVHEFKVGRVEDVVADSDAAPEIADIAMMETRSLTYTFAGSGPFGFACHEPGHFEAGMSGTITVVG
jgi:plastocyanin